MSPSLPRESIPRYVTGQDVASCLPHYIERVFTDTQLAMMWLMSPSLPRESFHRYVTGHGVANVSLITSREYSQIRNWTWCG